MKTVILIVLLYIIPFLFILRNVISSPTIAGGDYITLWPENIANFKNFPFFAWDSSINLGSNTLSILHYAPYNYLMGWIGSLTGYNIAFWERIVWWLPFFVLSTFSSIYLFKNLFPQKFFWYLSPLIFIFNTYILLILSGGQIAGIGLAYSIAPLVLMPFIILINYFSSNTLDKSRIITQNSKLLTQALLAGLIFSIQVMFDLRIAYITLVAVGLYLLFSILFLESNKKFLASCFMFLTSIVVPLGIMGILHAFWILPLLIYNQNPIEQFGGAYSSLEAVKFFSFAQFENTIGLIHPNWPENIFGKVYFMKSEFLLLPILAYSSLLFVNKPKVKSQSSKLQAKSKNLKNNLTIERLNNRTIIYFALLGLLGAFLAKGANEPFGQVYLWMFDHVPGFVMFRDSTKWYTLVAISYCILIPFSIYKIYLFLSRIIKFSIFNLQNLFLLFAICYLLFLIRPSIFGHLKGTFKYRETPQEYIRLKNFLSEQQAFSRTLWFPAKQRYGFTSSNSPAIYAHDFFHTTNLAELLKVLKKEQTPEALQNSSVRYIIVPYDSEQELFIKDRKYNETLYKQTVKELDKLKWLKKSHAFGEIIVYELADFKNHFWISSKNNLEEQNSINYSVINPTHYIVSISGAKKGDTLVFSENFDPNWTAGTVFSKPYNRKLNSFVLPKDGNFELKIFYKPQKFVNIGVSVSLVSFILVMAFIIALTIRIKKQELGIKDSLT